MIAVLTILGFFDILKLNILFLFFNKYYSVCFSMTIHKNVMEKYNTS